MPFVGEEPITSFFKRLPPGGKHTENSGSLRSAAKRERPAIEAEANRPLSKKPKKQQRLVLSDTPQNAKGRTPIESRIPRRTVSYVSIPRGSSTTPPPVRDLSRSGIPRVRSIGAEHLAQLSLKSKEQTEQPSTANVVCAVNNSAKRTNVSYLPTPITGQRPGKLVAQSSLQTPPPTIYQKQKRRDPKSVNSTTSIPTPVTQGRYVLENSVTHPNNINRVSSSLISERRVSGLPSLSSAANGSRIDKPRQILAPQFLTKEMTTQHHERKPIARISDVSRAHSEDPFSLPFSQALVPSSQTQDNDISYTSFLSKSPTASPSFRTPSLPDRVVFGMNGVPQAFLSATNPEAVDDCQFVHSSQTQHMLPYHISPRRNHAAEYSSYRALSLDNLTGECPDEVIQSSQSQIERELDISKEISEYLPRMMDNTITAGTELDDKVEDKESPTCFEQSDAASHLDSPRSRNLSQTKSIARTLSDDLFPSSVLHLNFDGVFPEEIPQNRSDDSNLPSVHQELYESATEDESEEESEAVFTRTIDNGTAPTVPGHQSPILSRTVPSPCAADTDDENLNDTHAFAGSLPDALKDFRDMFGEGDGSYPDDFPMSLR